MSKPTNSLENTVIPAIVNEVLQKESENDKRSTMLESRMQEENVSPELLMNVLIPALFYDVSFDVTCEQAMLVLALLVTSNPSKYLKPASRCMKLYISTILMNNPTSLTLSDDVLKLMVSQLSTSSDVEVSSNITESLVACCHQEQDTSSRSPTALMRSLKALSQAFQTAWDQKVERKNPQHSSTSCVRCSAAVVMLCDVKTARVDDLTSKKRALDDSLLVILLDDSDPLLQMSALDLVEQLTTASSIQRDWLLSKEVLKPLLQMSGHEQDEPHPILGGSTIRILSSICKVLAMEQTQGPDANSDQNEISSWLLTRFRHILRNFIMGRSELDRLAQLDAISSFGSASPRALKILLDDDLIGPSWLSLSVAQPKLLSAILYSVAMVLNQHYKILVNSSSAPTIDTANANLCMRLFVMLGQVNNKGDNGSMPLVISLAKCPVTETRLGAYELLESVCRQSIFARLIFLNGSDLFEFLLSREGVETTVEGKEAKFKVVEAIYSQKKLVSVMDNKLVKALETHIKQGPHYRQTQSWDVATE
mmetsp:Transcript_25052/g.37850  ORF Transcript_25052/g.37850 Transcript_25052/m.37850 type:complete len:537 (-) Transcript_25052:198-1808(-)